MTPEATFPSSSFSPTSPSLNYNTSYPFNYNLMLKNPRDQYYNYRNPRNDLFPSQPTGLFFSYYPSIYRNSNSYPSDFIFHNRRNIYQLNNTSTFPYQNNTYNNSFIMKDDFSNTLDNMLNTSISEGNSLLSNSLSSNTSLSDSTSILSPLLFSECDRDNAIKNNEKTIETNPQNMVTDINNNQNDSMDILSQFVFPEYTNNNNLIIEKKNIKSTPSIIKKETEMKDLKKIKKRKYETITTSFEKLNINDISGEKINIKSVDQEKSKSNDLNEKMKIKNKKNKKKDNTNHKSKRQQISTEELLPKIVIIYNKKYFNNNKFK